MLLIFILLLLIIPLVVAYFLGNILLSKIHLTRQNRTITLTLTYLVALSLFIYCTVYFSFGPLFYGHRQADKFYNSNKNELHYLISDFTSLENKGLFEISKSSGNNLKITLELAANKGTIEVLVNNKTGKYELEKMSKDQPALIYNPNEPLSLQEILNSNQISKEQFERILEQFKKLGIYCIRCYGDEYLIEIRETFPFQIACLFFCKADDKGCNSDKGNARIDKGVYFLKLSNP